MAEILNALGESFRRYWEIALKAGLASFGATLVQLLLVLALTLFVARRLRAAEMRALQRTKAEASTIIFVGRLTYLGILALGLVWALEILGIPWTTLLAALGLFSLTVSLAIQEVLKNLVAGLYLLLERPFRLGEPVKVRDIVGVVETVGLRTTVLRTADGEQAMVPNAIIFAEVVVALPMEGHARQEAEGLGAGAEQPGHPHAERAN